MKSNTIFTFLAFIVLLLGIAYFANQNTQDKSEGGSQTETENKIPEMPTYMDETKLEATFAHPEGWKMETIVNALVFRSSDLKYDCPGGTPNYNLEDPGLDPCFRVGIATGSILSVINQGRAVWSLQEIPAMSTDDNNGNSIKNIKYLTVDGQPAVMWDDSYGENNNNRKSVVVIKDHVSYLIQQQWKIDSSNPYPELVADTVASFSFNK